MKKNVLILFLLLQLSTIFTSAQNRTQWLNIPSKNAIQTPTELCVTQKKQLGLSNNDALLFQQTHTDPQGMKHHRFQQYYKNYPIVGSIALIHTNKKGTIQTLNHQLSPNFNQIPTINISESTALQHALQHTKAQQYAWENPNLERLLQTTLNQANATYFPKGELVWYNPHNNQQADQYTLCYQFNIVAAQPLLHQYVYVSAADGNIIGAENHLCEATTTRQVPYLYHCTSNGNVSITVDAINTNTYQLKDNNRQIYTYQADGCERDTLVTISGTPTLSQQQAGIAAHYAAEKYYDYLRLTFNDTIISQGLHKMLSLVDVDLSNCDPQFNNNNNNAFWWNNMAIFGKGNNPNAPFVSLDIVGHEFTHGIIQQTANLSNTNEAGIINEALADIFGTLTEFASQADCADWTIAEDVVGNNGIRNIAQPSSTACPDTYKGDYWYNDGNPSQFVHTNSTLISHWFYLLCEGGNGINDDSLGYHVLPLDNTPEGSRNQAAQIIYKTLFYLTPYSGLADFRTATLQATADLYGNNSTQTEQVLQAWCAVGMGTCYTSDDYITILLPNGGETLQANTSQTITWTASPSIQTIDIDLSIDGGLNWINLSTNIPNTGLANCFLPNSPTTTALLKLTDHHNPATIDKSDTTFTILGCSFNAAALISSTNSCTNTPITWINQSNGAAFYEWYVDNTIIANSADFTYTFTQVGTHHVILVATDNMCFDNQTWEVNIQQTPNADFNHDIYGRTLCAYIPYAPNTEYTWYLGDGTTINNQQNITHTYTQAGNYTVTLIVNACNTTDTVSTDITIDDFCQQEIIDTHLTTDGHITQTALQGKYLWIGSYSGLTRLDTTDNSTTTYTTSNTILQENFITGVAVDHTDKVWIVTYGALYRIDGEQWTRFQPTNTNDLQTANGIIRFPTAVAIDDDNHTWVTMINGHIAEYDPITDSWANYLCPDQSSIRSISIDHQGNKWMTADNHTLLKFSDNEQMHFTSMNSPLPDTVDLMCVAIDQNNIKWIGTEGGGLFRFDDTTPNDTTWQHFNINPTGTYGNRIRHIAVDANNRKYLSCTYSGYVTLDDSNPNNPIFTTYNHATWFENNWGWEYVPWYSTLDSHGNKWISTGQGLIKFRNDNDHTIIPISNTGLRGFAIGALYTASDGKVWVGMIDDGIGAYNPATNTWQRYRYVNNPQQLPKPYIFDITEDKNHTLWAATGNGITRYDPNTDTWIYNNEMKFGINEIDVLSIAVDNNNIKWLACNNPKRIIRYNDSTGDNVVYDSTSTPLSGGTIYHLTIDKNNLLWIGTNDGITTYDGNVWDTLSYDYLSNKQVFNIFIDENDDHWFCTNKGLYRERNGQWTVYDTLQFEKMIADKHGNKWVGGNRKLRKLSPTGEWTIYEAPMITSGRISEITIDPQGAIWASSDHGIDKIFDPTPNAYFTADTTACLGYTIHCENQSANATSHQWKIDGIPQANTTHLEHSFTTIGTHIISLTATNDSCSHTYSQTINIQPTAPSLYLGTDKVLCGAETTITLQPNHSNYTSYTWSKDGQTLSNTNNTLIVSQTGNYQLQVTDACGNTSTAAIHITIDDDCVLPGDTNNDNTVNYLDLLPIGLGYGRSGYQRPNATLNFIEQACRNWNTTLSNNLNLKHSDTNGDGIVANNDTTTINLNYGNTLDQSTTTTPTLTINNYITADSNPTIDTTPDGNGTIQIPILLNNTNNTSNLTVYGVAFKVNYSFNVAVTNPRLIFNDTWIGTEGHDLLTIQHCYPTNSKSGYIEVSMTRTDYQNTTNKGKAGSLIAEVDLFATGDTATIACNLTIEKAQKTLANGLYFQLTQGNPLSLTINNPFATPTVTIAQPSNTFVATNCPPTSLIATTTNCDNCSYLWQKNNTAIPNTNNSTYNATQGGTYSLIVTNANGLTASTSITLYNNNAIMDNNGNSLSYCDTFSSNATAEYIKQITFGTNPAYNNTNTASYIDATCTKTFLIGTNCPATITLQPKFTGSNQAEYWTVWLDRNNDGQFATSEKIWQKITTNGNPISKTFSASSLPSSLLNKTMRMRISMKRGSFVTSACENFAKGQTFDCTVRFVSSNCKNETDELSTDNTLHIYPNPVQNTLQYTYETQQEGQANINIYDLSGKLYWQGEQHHTAGQNTGQITVEHLPKGMYFLQINSDQSSVIQKFVR
jgi:Zn-dependent metalloprotease/ligand-binding sensor domain-containing protein